MDRYFAYDPENRDFSTYATEEEAKKAAEKILNTYEDTAIDDSWSDCTDEICYGKIMYTAVEHEVHPEDPPCGGKTYCANCLKGDLADGINDEDVCEDYDSENNGEEYLEYTLEQVEEVK